MERPGQDRQDSWYRAAWTGQPGQDSRDRTARTRKLGQENWDRKVRRTDRIVATGNGTTTAAERGYLVQDIQLRQGNRDGTTMPVVRGQLGHDI